MNDCFLAAPWRCNSLYFGFVVFVEIYSCVAFLTSTAFVSTYLQVSCAAACKYSEILISNIQKYLFQILRNTYFKYSDILSRKNRYLIVSNNLKYIFKKCIQIFYGITVFLQKYILIYSFISTSVIQMYVQKVLHIIRYKYI